MMTGRLMVLTTVLAVFAAGCLSKQAYPRREFFAVDPGRPEPAPATGSAHDLVLRIGLVRVASPFASQRFVYRTGEPQYESDYYNGFVDGPDRLLTASLVEWMSSSGAFRAVIDGDSGARYDVEMETNVVELYGDYRQPSRPRAVVAVRVFVLERQGASSRVLFTRRYDATVEMPASPTHGDPAALANAFGLAWRETLIQFTADIRQRSLTTQPATP